MRVLSEQVHIDRNRTTARPSYGEISPPGLVEDFSMDGMTTPSTSSSSYGITAQSQDFVNPLWADQDASNQNIIIDNSMFWNGDAVDRMFAKSGLNATSTSKKQVLAPNVHEATINATDMNLSNDLVSANRVTQSNSSTVQSQSRATACKCHAEVLEALHLSQHLGAGVRKSGDLHIPFDVLLAENKSAVGRCSSMLNCRPCFCGSTSFLLVAALLSQALTLYNLACEYYLARSPTETGIQRARSIVPGPLRINFGAYKLEEEDEILLKKELMLIELRKVEMLLSRLKIAADELEDQSENATYDALLTSLTRNLRQVVKTIQPGR